MQLAINLLEKFKSIGDRFEGYASNTFEKLALFKDIDKWTKQKSVDSAAGARIWNEARGNKPPRRQCHVVDLFNYLEMSQFVFY
jgi:hypothetical protein